MHLAIELSWHREIEKKEIRRTRFDRPGIHGIRARFIAFEKYKRYVARLQLWTIPDRYWPTRRLDVEYHELQRRRRRRRRWRLRFRLAATLNSDWARPSSVGSSSARNNKAYQGPLWFAVACTRTRCIHGDQLTLTSGAAQPRGA